MYKVAICEDELPILENTHNLCEDILNDLDVEHEISLFTSEEDLEYVLKKEGDPFHLLLLDIQLPEKKRTCICLRSICSAVRKWASFL